MSHTYTSGRFRFYYDSDLMGNVTIRNDKTEKEFLVSGKALRDFIAFCFVVPHKIERLEHAEDSFDVLTGK